MMRILKSFAAKFIEKLVIILDSISLQLRFLMIWKNPARKFWQLKSKSFFLYDRNFNRFRNPVTWWKRYWRGSYFKVYYDEMQKVRGHKLKKRKWGIFVIQYAELSYDADEWENLVQQQKAEESQVSDNVFYDLNQPEDLISESAFIRDADLILSEVRVRYDDFSLRGDAHYYYRSQENYVEFLEQATIKGLTVTGKNILKKRCRTVNHYIKKYRDQDGRYIGFDEYFRNKKRNWLRLFYNEDGILTLSKHTAFTQNKRELQEISHYDNQGRKVSSELYEGSRLQKSAKFVYNEDSKLIHIIQYGPDGNIL